MLFSVDPLQQEVLGNRQETVVTFGIQVSCICAFTALEIDATELLTRCKDVGVACTLRKIFSNVCSLFCLSPSHAIHLHPGRGWRAVP